MAEHLSPQIANLAFDPVESVVDLVEAAGHAVEVLINLFEAKAKQLCPEAAVERLACPVTNAMVK